MKIKIAILEKDRRYLERMTVAFTNQLADRLEVHAFSDKEVAIEALHSASFRIDVLLASEAFEIDVTKLPRGCGFAYFVDSMGVEELRGQKTICKYQRIELIYKSILEIYAESAEGIVEVSSENGQIAKILAFVSASGGTGSSSVAAACAKYLAIKERKVLYLNIEQFGSASNFFSAGGTFNLSDVIYAIKSNKSNLTLKLESTVKHDASGVAFFDSCSMAFDMMEVNHDDMKRLLEELKSLGKYEFIVVDMDFGFDKRETEVMKQAYRILFVSDGLDIGNTKLKKVLDAIEVFEKQQDVVLMRKIDFIYNKFGSQGCHTIENDEIKVLGGIPKLVGVDTAQVVDHIASLNVFHSFITE